MSDLTNIESKCLMKLVDKFDVEDGFKIYNEFISKYYQKHHKEMHEMYKNHAQWYKQREQVFDRYTNRILNRVKF